MKPLILLENLSKLCAARRAFHFPNINGLFAVFDDMKYSFAPQVAVPLEHTFPKYSICITNYNSGKTIKKAISSILPLLASDEFEIVVVDSDSSDDSIEYLKELNLNQIVRKLSIARCSRGRGRNLSFLISSGAYILANIDMDVVYDSNKILAAIRDYHERFEGKVLSVYGMMILPRQAAVVLGGWKDLDRHEDNELALHAYEFGLHAQNLSLKVLTEHLKDKSRNSLSRKILESYVSFRDWFRIGLRFSDLPGNQAFHPTVLGGYFS